MEQSKNEPPEYSNFWYRKQFRGVNHGLNRCLAEYADCWEAVKSLRERLGVLETSTQEALQKAQEEIGRQADEIAELKESIEKARKVFLELKQSKRKEVSDGS